MTTFSIVLPTHNAPATLTAAVCSVRRQTEQDWELMVVVDGDSEGITKRLRRDLPDDPRVTVLSTPVRRGPGQARRTGCEAARGRLIAYLDHDDEWRTDHLDTAASRLRDGAGLVATGAYYRDDDSGELRGTEPVHLAWHHELLLLNPIAEPSRVVHTAEAYRRAGPWPDLPGGFEDWALWLRMAEASVPVAVTAHRTVVAHLSTRSRRHTIRAPFALPITEFTGLPAATAWSCLTAPEATRRCAAAADADARAWLADLDDRGELVLPDGMSLATALTTRTPPGRSGGELLAGWAVPTPEQELAIVPGPTVSRLVLRTALPDRRWLPQATRILRTRRRRWRRSVLDTLTAAGARLHLPDPNPNSPVRSHPS
jgi:hypothetical protein